MSDEKSRLVSVVIPTFQHAATISTCIDSVFAQTYKHIEIIVVNDGSTDDTSDRLREYDDTIVVIDQDNRGANPARNRGLQEAKGEFVIFVDADVRMKPFMIERMVRALDQHPEASYAYSSFVFGWKVFRGIPFDKSRLRRMNFIHTTSLVRKADFPGFDEKIRRLQDWDVWLTMLEEGKTGVLVPETLFQVDVDGASRIGSSWLPSILYRIPWNFLGWRPMQIRKYEAARDVLKSKHNL